MEQQPGTLRFDTRELDHLGPFLDIFGDELGELVRRIGWHRDDAEISEPLLDVRIEHRRVGLLVEPRTRCPVWGVQSHWTLDTWTISLRPGLEGAREAIPRSKRL